MFDLRLFGFVCILFLLMSGKGCGLWLWHPLDFSLTFLDAFRAICSNTVTKHMVCTIHFMDNQTLLTQHLGHSPYWGHAKTSELFKTYVHAETLTFTFVKEYKSSEKNKSRSPTKNKMEKRSIKGYQIRNSKCLKPSCFDPNCLTSFWYGIYISQLIRFARVSIHVSDFNTRNKLLTAKLLIQAYRYHKLRKAFLNFIDVISI